jgi:hypothetical protein
MTDPIHQQVLGHLFGALDDGEQAWVESRLECDGDYRRQCLKWRRRLAPLDAARPDFEPPPGLAERTCRLVAASGSMPRRRRPSFRRMSADVTVGHGSVHGRWLDVAVVMFIVAAIGSLTMPAIQNSRSHARMATCQQRLQQVGQALTQYGYRQGHALSDFADNERLTPAGLFAACRIEEELADDSTAIPDAWLAAQGILHWSRQVGSWIAGLETPASSNTMLSLPSEPMVGSVNTPYNQWSDTWRADPTGSQVETQPATTAMLADAPMADLSGQTPDWHGGQGRNVFFEDGHVCVMPSAMSHDAAGSRLAGDASFVQPRVFIPVSFIAGPKHD